MNKRMTAVVVSLLLVLAVVLPQEASAKPPWWERFKDIVVADAVGALDGFVQTESLGGAVAGGIAGSIEEGRENSIGVGGWNPSDAVAESVGLHHNLGLNFYYEQGAPEENGCRFTGIPDSKQNSF